MTAPAPDILLGELHRRGAHVRVLPGGALEIRPRRVLDDRLRTQLRERKAEVVALLSRVVAETALPPPTRSLDMIVDEMVNDPAVRRALDWAAQSAPLLADAVIAALGRIDHTAHTGTAWSDSFGTPEAALDTVLRAHAALEPTPAAADAVRSDAPPVWRLVVDRHELLPGPIRLDAHTVVENVPRFVDATLADAAHAIAAKNAGNDRSMLVVLLDEYLARLRACGCSARVEATH